MDPMYLEMMANKVQHGRFLLCPNGSHLALHDDRQVYMDGLIAFLKDVDSGTLSAQQQLSSLVTPAVSVDGARTGLGRYRIPSAT